MSPFPREDYRVLRPYDPGRTPVPVDLSDNTNLWGPHPDALEVIREGGSDTLTRYPTVYGSALKEAVARKHGVPTEAVTTGCGSDDLLDSVFRASVLPPGRMAYPAPSFSMVEVFARMNGMEPEAVPWAEAEVDPLRLLQADPDLVYLCRPNNPTGASLTWEWVMELLAQAGPDGPLVVLDEAYADFAGESLLQEAPDTDRLLVLRTFSKLYGLAGLRVGFGVGSPQLIAEAEKSRGPYKVSHLAEKAAVAALEDRDGWAEEIRRAEEARRRAEAIARALQTPAGQGVSDDITPGFLCPVAGPSAFADTWGAPRSGGRTHKGVDMMGARGTPLVAVGDGYITTSYGVLGGNIVWLHADHGVSYFYAHLDGYPAGLVSGQRVARGDVIGYMGDTGNPAPGAYHLHFGLYPGGSSAVNPYPTVARHC